MDVKDRVVRWSLLMSVIRPVVAPAITPVVPR